jgi:hypothetical protein
MFARRLRSQMPNGAQATKMTDATEASISIHIPSFRTQIRAWSDMPWARRMRRRK